MQTRQHAKKQFNINLFVDLRSVEVRVILAQVRLLFSIYRERSTDFFWQIQVVTRCLFVTTDGLVQFAYS